MNEKNLSLVDQRFRQMLDHGVTITAEIEADAKRLAAKMERVHGGTYLAHVDHEFGIVFVRPQ